MAQAHGMSVSGDYRAVRSIRLTSIKKATKPILTGRHHPVQKNMGGKPGGTITQHDRTIIERAGAIVFTVGREKYLIGGLPKHRDLV
ncbi:hypothetical protein VC33_03985 [Pseudomonas fluorescens]|nr:hypothetical protein VC33_03985 [Pseudomonas fluorescens]